MKIYKIALGIIIALLLHIIFRRQQLMAGCVFQNGYIICQLNETKPYDNLGQ